MANGVYRHHQKTLFMKKVVLHLFVFSLLLFAQQAFASHASIVVQAAGRYTVTVNQIAYPHNLVSFNLSGLLPGAYRVQIATESPNRHRPASNNAAFNRVVFDGWVELKPYETFTAVVERNGLVRTFSVIDAPPPVVMAPLPACHEAYGYYPIPVAPVVYGMAPDRFFSLKQTVINASFDSTKRELLKSALLHNNLTAQQLYELLNLLDFDSSKLEIAKTGYASVVDKENFHTVYNAFTFDSSISELIRWIG